jgi:hypothetical protein
MVTVADAATAVDAAVNVTVLVPAVLAGLNDAVTPLGNPVAVKFTLLLKPFSAFTVIVLDPVPPGVKLTLAGVAASVKFGVTTATAIVVVIFRMPAVPVMVTGVAAAATAELAATKVKVLLVVVLAGLKVAVTPLGSPVTVRLTLLLKPAKPVTVTVPEPLLPAIKLRVLGEAASVKVGTVAVTLSVAVLFKVPAVPVTVTVELPAVIELAAIRASVPGLLVVAGVKEAVTPLGNPDAVKLMLPPNPFAPVAVSVVVVVLPGVKLTLFGDAANVKLGTAIVRAIAVVLFKIPEVPVTVIVAVPPVAELAAVNVRVLDALVLLGLNVAVTPFGRPAATRLTLALKLFSAFTAIVLVPVPPGVIESVAADADRVKLGEAGAELRSLIKDCPAGVPQPVAKS